MTAVTTSFPANIYLFQVNNWNNRRYEIRLKLTIKEYFITFSSVSIVDFDQVHVSWFYYL